MPTGYTHILIDKPKTTFKQWVLRCARAMGACVMQRDESMDNPPRFTSEGTKYNEQELLSAKAQLERLEKMTLLEAETQAFAEFMKDKAAYDKMCLELSARRKVFGAMRAKVEQWEPPSEDHEGLKEFMLQQLDTETPFLDPPDPPKKRTDEQWLADSIQSAKDDVEYHEQQIKSIRERDDGRQKWLAELFECLEKED